MIDDTSTFSSPLLEHIGGFIAGEWVESSDGTPMPVFDPSNGNVLGHIPQLGAKETTRAVEAAHAALTTMPGAVERGEWLKRIAALLTEHNEEFARIITHENGKPLTEARGEVAYAAAFYAYSAASLSALESHVLEARPKNHTWTVHHRPAGVVGLITPWNFPLAMLAKKLAAALAAGCTSVVKAAEITPLTCIAFFRLLEKLKLPPGTVNLVIGDAPAIGIVLCEHPNVRVLSFTGSTAVGRILATQAAPHLKRLSLELGGNAPFIVCEDADLDAAVTHLLANKFRATGQTCVCTNRVLVHEKVADAFTERVAAAVSKLVVGPGMR
ncbi:MAG: succinate-semialdehyde dehydrogenase/glutarate-semialdehyde dehydrogenase, partial [Polyangiales bacterium]